MPAQPDSQLPFANLDKFFEQLRTAADSNSWWNHVDRGVLDWDGHEFSAGSTGLFFLAAQINKTVHAFSFIDFSIKLPDEYKDPGKEEKRLAIEFINKIDNIKELTCIKKHLKENDDPCFALKIYCNVNTILSLSVDRGPKNLRVSISIRSLDGFLVDKIRNLTSKYITSRTKDPQLFAVSENDEGQLILISIGKPGAELERGNYNENVLESFDFIVEQFSSNRPFGRLAIMYGPPGTGKTYILRGLINSIPLEKGKFIFLQPEFLFKHSVSSLTRLLLGAVEDGSSIVLLIEDADDCLLPRQSDNMAAISTLLNLADGLIGSMLDIRIIATTNANKLDIDPALKRQGRLCRIVEVDKLSVDRANDVVKRISNNEGTFKSSVVLAEAYAAALGVSAEKTNNKLGFSNR